MGAGGFCYGNNFPEHAKLRVINLSLSNVISGKTIQVLIRSTAAYIAVAQ